MTLDDELTPKDTALRLVRESNEFLVLVPLEGDPRDKEQHWEYIWVTEDTGEWETPLEEFLKVASSPVEAKKP